MIIRNKLTTTAKKATIAGMAGVILMVLMALEFGAGDAFATSYSYSITYNDSVVSDMPVDTTGRSEAASVLLSSTSPTLSGYNFLGWCTTLPAADGSCSGTAYSAGSTYTLTNSSANNNLALYARWEKAGEAWYFNETIDESGDTYDINFTSSGYSFNSIVAYNDVGGVELSYTDDSLNYTCPDVFNDSYYDGYSCCPAKSQWCAGESFRTIVITGGNDFNTPSFRSWLSANATQL